MVKLRVDLVLTSVSADGKKSYSYAYKTWTFYMKTDAIVPYESSEFLKKYRINLPESITAEVQSLLSDYAKKLYGNIYEFILPLDTNELYDLGEAMHNCVGTLYRNAALKRLSIIVGMKLNGKYQACIEIKTKDKEITQALAPATEIFLLKSGTLSENGHWKEILALLQLILGDNHVISFWNSTNTFWDLWFWLHL